MTVTTEHFLVFSPPAFDFDPCIWFFYLFSSRNEAQASVMYPQHQYCCKVLFKMGFSLREIARATRHSISTVWYNIHQRGTSRRSRVAPPKERLKRKLFALLRRYPFSSLRSLQKRLRDEQNIRASRETVRRVLTAAGLVSRIRPVTSGFRPGDDERRVVFAERELALSQNIRERTIFVDEKIFYNHDYSSRTMWVRPGTRVPLRHRYRWAPHFHVFAAIGIGFRFILVGIDGRLTSDRYQQEVLRPLFQALGRQRLTNIRLVQDGAPCHRSASTMEWLSRRNVEVVPEWPPRSPFLNPVENLWAMMMRDLSLHPDAGTEDRDRFGEMISEVFFAVPQDQVDALAGSYTRRLEDCVRNVGRE